MDTLDSKIDLRRKNNVVVTEMLETMGFDKLEDSYKYLVESIRRFPSQESLIELMQSVGFISVKVRNLSGGIVAIHSGWKY